MWGPTRPGARAHLTTSPSTPRLRQTLFAYGLLVILTAFNRPTAAAQAGAAVLSILALLAVSASVLGRIWCSVFIAGRKDRELVSTGPYALCRHPLYGLSMLAGLGLGLACGSWILTAALLAFLTWQFLRAVHSEEALLLQLHGAEFRRYAETTPRFWPSRSSRVASASPSGPGPTPAAIPERIDVWPAVLWKSFLDGGSMVLLLACVMAAAAAQRAGWAPALLHWP
jgi:protein-S-isoprenylcysteine O-methyltransferase Ste14